MAANIELLSLPPEDVYRSLEATKTGLNLHSMSAGYAFVTGKNEPRSGTRLILK